jgi:N utilization substance protein B
MKIEQPRPRTAARVAAVQALFQSEQGPENPETVIDQFVRHRFAPGVYEDGLVPEPHAKLFGRIVRAAATGQERLDTLLAEALPPEWPLSRLDPVLRALLRAAGAELAMPDGAPSKVVINEYLDVAHGFFDGEEPKMANGLLNNLARALRPKEFNP